jgi:dTDP-4-dehydrorhamnose reductase
MAADPKAVIVRSSWLFGPSEGNFVTTMLRLAETNGTLRVVADQHGVPTELAELSGALLRIIDQLLDHDGEGGIYHVAGSGETTWFEFARAIFAGSASRGGRMPQLEAISLAQWGGPARRPLYSSLDCAKAERTFGIRLPPWQDSLERCLDQIARAR